MPIHLDYAKRIKILNDAVRSRSQGIDVNIVQNTFAYIKGRMFDRWVDFISGSARSNGYNTSDLIDNPAYIIESLLRDENFTERDLAVTDVTDVITNLITIGGLLSSEDDYYNYAIYYNASTDHKTYITDYDGATKVLTLYNADLAATTDSVVFIQNIKGDVKIDYSSFDVVGNTTSGTRKDMVFARSYTTKSQIRNLLDELCFESHCELVESADTYLGINKYKLIAIESGSGDTWTNPAYSGGLEQINAYLTPLENIYTQFRLRYFYDYGKGDFIKEIYVDKNGFPSTATLLSATEQGLCADAETNYKVSRLFEYSSMNIYDDATAEMFLQYKIGWFTKQRLSVNYITPIVGNSDWIKYEIGDQVKLNFSKGIPTGLNNSSMFMITNKTITPLIGGGHISWELIEL